MLVHCTFFFRNFFMLDKRDIALWFEYFSFRSLLIRITFAILNRFGKIPIAKDELKICQNLFLYYNIFIQKNSKAKLTINQIRSML